jgi:hypothetical protein
MKKAMIFGLLLLLIVPWVVARWWIGHGSWWFSVFPRWGFDVVHWLARPFLSKEAWEAEEQLEFLVFWGPSFILFASLEALVFWHWSRKNRA